MATMWVPTLGSKEGVTGRLCNVIITFMATNKNNPKQNASTSKRMRQEDTDDDVDIPKTTSWPRYLVMTGSDITTYIKAGYLNIPVSPYIPNPLRCFTCQRFGHASNRCKRTVMCARCAEEGHNDQNCTQAYKCVNCGESHPAYKKDCRAYKCEYQIQYIKTTKNVSFVEARNEYVKQSSGAPSGGSYASAVRPDKPKYTSISTQTDIQWVKDQAIVKNTEEVRTITPTVAKSVSVQCDTMLSDTVLSTPAKPSNAGDAVKPPEGNTSTKAKPGDSSTSSAGTVKSCTADETLALKPNLNKVNETLQL